MSTTPLLSQVVSQADDEIDLRQLAASLGRRWRLIAAVAGGSLALSGVLTLLQKPVWEGEFQIVLASKEGTGGKLAQLAAANPMLAGVAGINGGGGKDSLETEVKVLESPSVLRPVFDFVRASKQRAGDDVDGLRYADWLKGNLEIKLEKGTSVLNIAYRDNNPSLVLPVIERISRAYQDYSGRDRRRDISNGITYLQARINELEPKAEASMRRAQAFALANGLGLQDAVADEAGKGGGAVNTSVDAARTTAQAQVISLRQQLRNARAAGAAVLFQAPQLEANKDLYSRYQEVESNLAEKRSRLHDNDPIVRNLERQRSALAATLNRETIALLEGQLATAEARLQSASRPRDVVLEHRALMRQAARDEKTLTELENQLQLSKLEQARQADPWELISTPTLLDKPVSPKKGRNLALGLLAGLVLGSAAALVAERRSGLVFATDELSTALPGERLAELSAEGDHSAVLQLLASGPLAPTAGLAGPIALIPVGELDPDALEGLRAGLEAASQRPVQCSSDLMASRSSAHQLLVASPGACNRQQLAELRQQLQLQGQPLAGWLLLHPHHGEA